MFDSFPKEVLMLRKMTGEIIKNIEAVFDGKMFFIDDTTIPLEEGDIFERELPNGFIERYEIIDRGFFKGFGGIPDNYQVSVKKITGIKKSTSEKHTYNITASQVNIANDNANINANQYNGVDIAKLNFLISDIRKNVPSDISDEDLEILNDNLEVVEHELTQPEPKKGFVKTAINGLKALKGTAEFAAAITSLYLFITEIFK